MAADRELRDFIAAALGRGIGRDEIRDVLMQAGWPREQVLDGLRGFAELQFPIPVPRARPYLSAREAFVYLVLFATLYISAVSLNTLVFKVIERAFPDPMDMAYEIASADRTMRWSIASVIIAFPVFLWVSRSVLRSIACDPNKRASRIRKWLTYLTLFGASMVPSATPIR
jgi:Domain of unknown function (DUF5671)